MIQSGKGHGKTVLLQVNEGSNVYRIYLNFCENSIRLF